MPALITNTVRLSTPFTMFNFQSRFDAENVTYWCLVVGRIQARYRSWSRSRLSVVVSYSSNSAKRAYIQRQYAVGAYPEFDVRLALGSSICLVFWLDRATLPVGPYTPSPANQPVTWPGQRP